MIQVLKGKPSQDFLNLKNVSDWDREVSRTVKVSVRKYILVDEQNGVSAYTEKPLDEEDKNLHVDHFYKQVLYPSRSMDWNNLVVDEHNKNYGADHKDSNIHQSSDYGNLINPVNDNPVEYFGYMANGEIIPKDDLSPISRQKAEQTIKTFNLNHPELVNRRANVLVQITELKYGGLSEKEIKDTLCEFGFPTVLEFFTEKSSFACI